MVTACGWLPLTLSGFKSFADTTEFTFDEAITGIVGPNGCGKSNVVDAIKWVLGERSSKSLRGTEMIDVIFAGSAARKPLGMAGVTLTFENPVVSEAPAEVGGPAAAPVATIAEESPDQLGTAVAGADETEIVIDRAAAARAGRRRGLPFDADIVEVERGSTRRHQPVPDQQQALPPARHPRAVHGTPASAPTPTRSSSRAKVDAMLLASPTERRTIFGRGRGNREINAPHRGAAQLERAETSLVGARQPIYRAAAPHGPRARPRRPGSSEARRGAAGPGCGWCWTSTTTSASGSTA